MHEFKKGQSVTFEHDGKPVIGRVMRVNKKTVSVQPLGATDGQYFRVPPSLLQPTDELASALREVPGVSILRLTQAQVLECLADDRTPDATTRLHRIGAVFGNPKGRLSVVSQKLDVHFGNIRGWEAVAILMEAAGATSAMAGRLALEIDDEDSPMVTDGAVREWAMSLVQRLPWLPAWVPFDAGGFLLLNAMAPFAMRDGQPVVQKAQVEAAAWSANHAAAFLRQLGQDDISPALRLMETVLGQPVPPGFFDGIEGSTGPMDQTGRTSD